MICLAALLMWMPDNVLMIPADLTSAERSLWKAFPSGGWVDLRAGDERDDPSGAERWGAERTVRAAVIARLLLGAAAPEPGCFPAVRLRGARVAGQLDVTGATVGCALICAGCWFDTDLRFAEATTKTVQLDGCRVAGFDGARMRTEGILSFAQARVGSGIVLDRAVITGEVSLSEAVIDGRGGEALRARGLAVSGDLDGTELTTQGPVRLRNARIDSSLILDGAKVTAPGDRAVDATNAQIGAGLHARQMTVEGETRLRHTRITGSLNLSSAQLRNPGGAALSAGGLTVESGVWCPGLSATREVRLVGARLRANVTLTGAQLANPGGVALNLEHAAFSDLDATGLTVSQGTVSLIGADVAGRVNLAGAQLAAGPARWL